MSVSLIPAPSSDRAVAELRAVASTAPSKDTTDQAALPGAFAKLFDGLALVSTEPTQGLPTLPPILAQTALPDSIVPSAGPAAETAVDLPAPPLLLPGQTDDGFRLKALPVPVQPNATVQQAKPDADAATSPAPLPGGQTNALAHYLQPTLPGIGKTVSHPARLIMSEGSQPDHFASPGPTDPAVSAPAEPASPWPDVQKLPELFPATLSPVISGNQGEPVPSSGPDIALTSPVPMPPARYGGPLPVHRAALPTTPSPAQFGPQATGPGNIVTANLPPATPDKVEPPQQLQLFPYGEAVPEQIVAGSDLPKLAPQKSGTTIASHTATNAAPQVGASMPQLIATYGALSKTEVAHPSGTVAISRTGAALQWTDTPGASVQANGTPPAYSTPPAYNTLQANLSAPPGLMRDTATSKGDSPVQSLPTTAEIAPRRSAPSSPAMPESTVSPAPGPDELTLLPAMTNSPSTYPTGLHRQDTTMPGVDPGNPVEHSSRATAAHVATQVAQAAQTQASGSTDITLNPKELGHVRLNLQTVDGTMFVAIVAERPETADLMRRHIESLAQEFRGLGYQDVSFSFSGRQSGQGNNGQPASPNSGADSGPDPRHPPDPTGDIPADRFSPRRTAAQTGGTGLDLRL